MSGNRPTAATLFPPTTTAPSSIGSPAIGATRRDRMIIDLLELPSVLRPREGCMLPGKVTESPAGRPRSDHGEDRIFLEAGALRPLLPRRLAAKGSCAGSRRPTDKNCRSV